VPNWLDSGEGLLAPPLQYHILTVECVGRQDFQDYSLTFSELARLVYMIRADKPPEFLHQDKYTTLLFFFITLEPRVE